MTEDQLERAKQKIQQDEDLKVVLRELKSDCLELVRDPDSTALMMFRRLGIIIDELVGDTE